MNRPVYIFDIEGTLSISKWREHFIPNYDQFHSMFPHDAPYMPIVEIARQAFTKGDVIILTGMMEKHREKAVNWLSLNQIHYTRLVMRPDDNYKPSPEFKMRAVMQLGILNRVVIAFDDRKDVADVFNSNFIPTVLVRQEPNGR